MWNVFEMLPESWTSQIRCIVNEELASLYGESWILVLSIPIDFQLKFNCQKELYWLQLILVLRWYRFLHTEHISVSCKLKLIVPRHVLFSLKLEWTNTFKRFKWVFVRDERVSFISKYIQTAKKRIYHATIIFHWRYLHEYPHSGVVSSLINHPWKLKLLLSYCKAQLKSSVRELLKWNSKIFFSAIFFRENLFAF